MPQEIESQMRYNAREPRGDSNVIKERPQVNEAQGSGQILQFQLRRRVSVMPPRPVPAAGDVELPDDLAQYEQEDLHINYRHRMLMNVMAVMVVSALVGAGVWIADTIEDMQKAQDCLLQGRQNCAPIEMPTARR
jgi:hypothetical protein